MNEVGAGLEAEVTTDGAGGRVEGVGGAEEDTADFGGSETLPDHADNGAGEH